MAFSQVTDARASTVVAERYPLLFERLPERIFTPLASTNRRQYWMLLCALYAKRFGPEAPLPPSNGFTVREIIADIGETLQYQDWSADENEGMTPATPLSTRAASIFYRLRDAGWLRVDRLGVREMVTVAPAVAQFMNQLVDFAHTGPVFISAKIRSIEASMNMLFDERTDGASLIEAAKQSRALLEHVRIAGTNVRDLMREIANEELTGEFVRRFFDDYVERMFIGDYKELRTREHPLARRQEILRISARIQQSLDLRTKLVSWYAEKRSAGDIARAEAMFERDLERVDDLQRIDEYLDRLDDEIRRANKLALAYLDYRLRATRPLDSLIDHAIQVVLANKGAVAFATAFGPGECISSDRLASPRVQSKRAEPSALRKQVVSPEQEARARLQMLARERRMMSPQKLAAFVRQHVGPGQSVESLSLPTDSIEAVRAFQALCTIDTAMSSSSGLIKENARFMASGFVTRRVGEQEELAAALSHTKFEVSNTRKSKEGGAR